ncbi:MAG: hypothetical protein ACOYL6_11860 [Bacteriovoracaceae bacterium]
MKKNKCFFCLFFFLLFSSRSFAYQNDFALKMGVAYTYTRVSQVEITDALPLGFGLSSHVGYRWEKWEINMSSYLNFSKLKSMIVEANGSTIKGDGNFQSVTFGPTFRYHIHEYAIKSGSPYVVGGVHTAVQTMNFGVNSVTVDGGNFNDNHKLTLEGYGFLTGIGLDQNKKEKHNYYMELIYVLNASRKTSEVAGTTQVELIARENSHKRIFENTFFLCIGMTLF